MPVNKAVLPRNETARLRALRESCILDTPPEECYDDITHLASEICGAPISLVSLVDRDRQWFMSRVGLDVMETPRDVSFCGHAILDSELMVINDARKDARFADNPLVTGEPRIRFYAGAPLATADGQNLGTLCVIDKVERTLSEGQAEALRALSRQVIAQLELRRHMAAQERHRRALEESRLALKEANAHLHDATLTDDVSGFRNTRFLHQFLDRNLGEEARRDKLSLVFFDMDRFKVVVDTHGHLLGAKVLREVAEVVDKHLHPEDRIVRYGGDEYVVILPGQDGERAKAKVERLRAAIGETPFLQDEGIGLRVTASFGLATFPDDAFDKRQLLAQADQCLFESKARGRNRVSVRSGATPEM